MTILKSESIDMKWTVLSDNRSCDDSLETEHGLSVLLETDHHRILMETSVRWTMCLSPTDIATMLED